jgi:hypothetical protein
LCPTWRNPGRIYLGLQPYHPEYAKSHLISEAKKHQAWLVLGWENIFRNFIVSEGGNHHRGLVISARPSGEAVSKDEKVVGFLFHGF